MPAIAIPHRNALLFQLLDLRCGGSVVRNRRLATVFAGAKQLCEVRKAARAPDRNIVDGFELDEGHEVIMRCEASTLMAMDINVYAQVRRAPLPFDCL